VSRLFRTDLLGGGGTLTCRKKKALAAEIRKKRVAMRLGRAKGNFLKYSMLPKRPGNCLAGCANKPPKEGPTTEPSDQTRGMTEKALG
jgi:hypothetical protein